MFFSSHITTTCHHHDISCCCTSLEHSSVTIPNMLCTNYIYCYWRRILRHKNTYTTTTWKLCNRLDVAVQQQRCPKHWNVALHNQVRFLNPINPSLPPYPFQKTPCAHDPGVPVNLKLHGKQGKVTTVNHSH